VSARNFTRVNRSACDPIKVINSDFGRGLYATCAKRIEPAPGVFCQGSAPRAKSASRIRRLLAGSPAMPFAS
jgi:hypothetical protein